MRDDMTVIGALIFYYIVTLFITVFAIFCGGEDGTGAAAFCCDAGAVLATWYFIIRPLQEERRREEYKKKRAANPIYRDYLKMDEFKAYMKERGFEVVWDGRKENVDKTSRDYNQLDPHTEGYVDYSPFKVVANKSEQQLKDEGIYFPDQEPVIGKYYFKVDCTYFLEDEDGRAFFWAKDRNAESFDPEWGRVVSRSKEKDGYPGTDPKDRDYVIAVGAGKSVLWDLNLSKFTFSVYRRVSGLTVKRNWDDLTNDEIANLKVYEDWPDRSSFFMGETKNPSKFGGQSCYMVKSFDLDECNPHKAENVKPFWWVEDKGYKDDWQIGTPCQNGK